MALRNPLGTVPNVMYWFRQRPTAAAGMLALLLVLLSGAMYYAWRTTADRATAVTTAAKGLNEERSNTPEGSQEETPPATTAKPVPDFVAEFVTRVNELNALISIGDNRTRAGELYSDLWRSARSAGNEVYGLTGADLDGRRTDAGQYEVIELVTLEGKRFCVADVLRLDKNAAKPAYLFQGLYLGSCKDMLNDPKIT